jgi:hypothetical protein
LIKMRETSLHMLEITLIKMRETPLHMLSHASKDHFKWQETTLFDAVLIPCNVEDRSN